MTRTVDLATAAPLCGERRFAEIVAGMVADGAPRVFAIVREFGTRYDARIVAWGITFEDRGVALSVDGSAVFKTGRPEDMVFLFGGEQVTPRLVWVNPDASTPDVDEDIPS